MLKRILEGILHCIIFVLLALWLGEFLTNLFNGSNMLTPCLGALTLLMGGLIVVSITTSLLLMRRLTSAPTFAQVQHERQTEKKASQASFIAFFSGTLASIGLVAFIGASRFSFLPGTRSNLLFVGLCLFALTGVCGIVTYTIAWCAAYKKRS